MVDHGHAVLFDSSGSYAINKASGKKTAFVRKGKGWDLTLQLEAPERANAVMHQVVAELREEKARKEQPGIELSIAGKVVADEIDRADPVFRLAMPVPGM